MGDVGVVSDVLRQGGRQGAVGPVLIRYYNSTITKARTLDVLRPLKRTRIFLALKTKPFTDQN